VRVRAVANCANCDYTVRAEPQGRDISSSVNCEQTKSNVLHVVLGKTDEHICTLAKRKVSRKVYGRRFVSYFRYEQ
jgi:hypothetical protein